MIRKNLIFLVCLFLSLQYISFVFAEEKEVYEKINPSEFSFNFYGSMKRLHVDSAGNVLDVEGEVDELSLSGNKLALESKALTKIGNDVFIITKDYGKIKVTFNSNGQAKIWLTPKQKKMFKKLLKSEDLLVASEDLLVASQEGHMDVVKELLARGADVNAKTNTGATALSAASQGDHSEIFQLLKKAGAKK